MLVRARGAIVLALAGVSCVGLPTPPSALDDSEGASNSDASTTALPQTSGVTTVPTPPADTGATTNAATSDGNDTSAGSACEDSLPDGYDCDLWDSCCADGEKCMPWANDGGSTLNATRCSPSDGNPDAPGDGCVVEGSATSGLDTCVAGSVCWDVNPETNQGVCRALCQGTEDDPICDDEKTVCAVVGGFVPLCIFSCDPLLQDCGGATGCYPALGGFACQPNTPGGTGDPCEAINECDPGLLCIDVALLPNCMGADGCCVPFCDVSGGSSCPMGTTCTNYYDSDKAPPGFEDVGVCID